MLKATFEISMISRNDTVNLSNMPVEFESPVAKSGINTELFHDQDHADWKYTRFQVTPLVRSVACMRIFLLRLMHLDVHVCCSICQR